MRVAAQLQQIAVASYHLRPVTALHHIPPVEHEHATSMKILDESAMDGP